MEYNISINGGDDNMATMPRTAGFSVEQLVDLSQKENRVRLSPSAIKGFLAISSHWNLTDYDARHLLRDISNGSFYKMKNEEVKILDSDQLTRISLLLGIYNALNTLYSQPLADAWVSRPNTNSMFGGAAPIEYMKFGGIPALERVRQLLDSRRG
jgi:hypothetical protein